MPRKMSKEEITEKFENAKEILEKIVNNRQIPRNIRRLAEETINLLDDQSLSPAARAASAIQNIENMAYDPNMPIFARMWVWRCVAILEPIRD